MAPEERVPAGRIGRLKTAALARGEAIRRRVGALDHGLRAWAEYKRHRGDLLAGAVTFFSFLSLFPLILLGVSVAGFVLQSSPDLQSRLFDAVTDNLPGAFGDTVTTAIDSAISSRASVGLIGLVTLLFTGLGWVGNLRAATEGIWGQPPAKRPFVLAKLADLLVLVGLGLAVIVSLGFTVAGSALSTHILDWVGLGDVAGLGVVTRIVGIGLGGIGDVLIFGWLMVRLPRVDVPPRVVLGAAVLAAVGFEGLKLIGTYYIARVTQSPTAGIFGSVIGILVWLNLVARYLLLCVAWAAVDARGKRKAPAARAAEDRREAPEDSGPGPGEGVEPGADLPAVSPAVTAAVLLGAGAAAGAGATVAARRLLR